MMEIATAISQLRWLLLLAISAGLVFAILFSIITTNVTTKPIRELSQATKSLAIGELNSRVSVAASGEIGELSNNFNQMVNRIETQIHEISRERNLRNSILSKMVEGVLLIDAQFAITYANSAAITMLDFPVHYQVLSLVEIIPDPALKRLLRQVTDYETCKIKKPYSAKSQIGLRVTLPDGFEPPTKWLTATCSTS